jgi:cellulose biosynthesis protein BcsQ
MTRTLVLTNHKGGVGKSTSATNIAFGLVNMLRAAGAANPRVLLVDTYSQGQLHSSLPGAKITTRTTACMRC